MINVDFKMFLDRPHVMQRITAKQRRVFAKSGGFGRQAMRRQMRPGGKKHKSSQPGEPPRTHGDRLLRKLIYFGLEPEAETVVIGPELTHGGKKTKALGGQTVPSLLDDGGYASLTFPDGNTKVVEYLPRPFTDPIRPSVEEFYERQIKETPL